MLWQNIESYNNIRAGCARSFSHHRAIPDALPTKLAHFLGREYKNPRVGMGINSHHIRTNFFHPKVTSLWCWGVAVYGSSFCHFSYELSSLFATFWSHYVMVEGQKDGNVRSQLYGATRRPGNYRTTGVRSEKAEHFFLVQWRILKCGASKA